MEKPRFIALFLKFFGDSMYGMGIPPCGPHGRVPKLLKCLAYFNFQESKKDRPSVTGIEK
jgi:hypothetical protein